MKVVQAHCKRGHALTPENLRPNRRECLTCHRTRVRGFGLKRIEMPNYPCGHPRSKENARTGNRGCKTCHREKQLARYHANPARSIAAVTAWANANRPRLNERIKKWRRDNPAQQARMHLRAGRRNREEPTIAYAVLLKRDPCSYCAGVGGSLDHIIPITRDGETDWKNLTAACGRCNSSKNNRSLLQFLLMRRAHINLKQAA